MGASETITSSFLDIINGLTPDLDELYDSAHEKSLEDWRLQQRAMVAASGAASVVIPGLHLAGIAADVAFVLNRMSVSAFGTGAILANGQGIGNILEKEDFAAVLGYWGGDDELREAMKGKGAATVGKLGSKVGTKIAGKAYAKGMMKTMLSSSGYLVGQRLGGKAMAKSGANFAGKFGGKLAGGFIPVVGPIVSGGINIWLISGIITASESFYEDKIALIRS